ncbi:sulfur carrier protein ThiS [Halalkalibacter sp. APA_J-10(15)]|uniref:sulfur carrier protein ThiS n=1 Tax=unclassified Halalkalibacter TaxID=2893063 RepID=UPI001FF0FA25|nr:sulfur carrier protein ThiS [Halalkalibacter sp. APA_J-10(15)]MCK0471503.1 sulfur carrier protein ThiS [Halalkalibacter sp. APA_J-10(15)]
MQLLINGEEHQLNVGTLDEVVAHFELESQLVVTEVDGEIIDRSNWTTTAIKEGMKIELVQFVGGG